MNAKTLKALKGSIAKWKAIVAGTGTDNGVYDCPLCAIYADRPDCDGCPVARRAKRGDCGGTPYVAWVEAGGKYGQVDSASRKNAARAELRFLKSLLPKVKK